MSQALVPHNSHSFSSTFDETFDIAYGNTYGYFNNILLKPEHSIMHHLLFCLLLFLYLPTLHTCLHYTLFRGTVCVIYTGFTVYSEFDRGSGINHDNDREGEIVID